MSSGGRCARVAASVSDEELERAVGPLEAHSRGGARGERVRLVEFRRPGDAQRAASAFPGAVSLEEEYDPSCWDLPPPPRELLLCRGGAPQCRVVATPGLFAGPLSVDAVPLILGSLRESAEKGAVVRLRGAGFLDARKVAALSAELYRNRTAAVGLVAGELRLVYLLPDCPEVTAAFPVCGEGGLVGVLVDLAPS